MASDLHGRIALVTGASGGIGSDIAVRLAAAGCDVAVHWSSNEEAAQRVVTQVAAHGVRARAVRADLADAAAIAGLVDEVGQRLGPVDVLVPNAGVSLLGADLAAIPLDDWTRTLAVNLTAPFLLAQRTVPGMADRGFGRVLCISSVAAFTGGFVGPHYAASKSGLHGMLFWLAKQYATRGVTANAIAPALVRTGMVPEGLEGVAMPMGRIGEPEEIGELALAIITNGYMTGQIVLADGGVHPH